MLILLSTEFYTFSIMVLGYMQTGMRLQRDGWRSPVTAVCGASRAPACTSAATATAGAHVRISLSDMGVLDTETFRGPHSNATAHFVMPYTLLPHRAVLHMGVRFTPGLRQTSNIQVRLNNTAVGTLTLEHADQASGFTVMELPYPQSCWYARTICSLSSPATPR